MRETSKGNFTGKWLNTGVPTETRGTLYCSVDEALNKNVVVGQIWLYIDHIY